MNVDVARTEQGWKFNFLYESRLPDIAFHAGAQLGKMNMCLAVMQYHIYKQWLENLLVENGYTEGQETWLKSLSHSIPLTAQSNAEFSLTLQIPGARPVPELVSALAKCCSNLKMDEPSKFKFTHPDGTEHDSIYVVPSDIRNMFTPIAFRSMGADSLH